MRKEGSTDAIRMCNAQTEGETARRTTRTRRSARAFSTPSSGQLWPWHPWHATHRSMLNGMAWTKCIALRCGMYRSEGVILDIQLWLRARYDMSQKVGRSSVELAPSLRLVSRTHARKVRRSALVLLAVMVFGSSSCRAPSSAVVLPVLR